MEINRYQTRKPKRLAVVTMGVKLGDETRGYTRFRFLSELLAREGFEVDLITSSFQHWDKAHRDTSKACYRNLPYNVVFIDEPGYTKNLDLTRIRSHRVAAKNLREHFERTAGTYDLVYAEIPPNDVARVCAEEADKQGIPFVADINDLWPEAMRMVVDVPVVSDVAFYPFSRDAKRVYQLLSAAVGTSDEYAARPAKDRARPYPKATVYVGNDLAAFDEGARINAPAVRKPEGELWVVYAGTLGASYDVATLVEAAALLDVGTGSGCIAATLALALPGAQVYAADISDTALETAARNCRALGAGVILRKADALSDLADVFPGPFDVIVSNPPYVPQSDLPAMHVNVREYEPHEALLVPDDDPLRFYRAIARAGRRTLRPGGRLYFEIYERFAEAMRRMLGKEGYTDTEVREDLNGKPRMTCSRLK